MPTKAVVSGHESLKRRHVGLYASASHNRCKPGAAIPAQSFVQAPAHRTSTQAVSAVPTFNDIPRRLTPEPLTKNVSELRAQLDRMPGSYRIVRKGKRVVAGMDAEEVLFALQDGPITVYRFYLLAPGNPATLAQPHTSIELLLGTSSRSDAA